METHVLALRLSEADYQALARQARAKRLRPAILARLWLVERLSADDRDGSDQDDGTPSQSPSSPG